MNTLDSSTANGLFGHLPWINWTELPVTVGDIELDGPMSHTV